MGDSFNSEQKTFIREHWNKPLLRFLTKRVNNRLLYLGLPSPKAEDILQWIQYLKSIIAFQCRVYGEKSDANQNRNAIEELNTLLHQLEREEQIENFIVFDGYLEEVVLRGYDNSPNRIDFEISDFITLFNLDFCNKITSPIEFVDINGEQQSAYKFNAINKLLQIQQSLGTSNNKFVFFLTVHCSYDGEELQHFTEYPPNEEIRNYIQRYRTLRGYKKNSRIVRLFFAYQIQQQFAAFGFIPKILPSLIYTGLKGAQLLHFTVLGISIANTAGGVPFYQSLANILNQKFVSIDDSKFINSNDEFEGESEVELDPVKLFAESDEYFGVKCTTDSGVKCTIDSGAKCTIFSR